jgi:hypothetical protein
VSVAVAVMGQLGNARQALLELGYARIGFG